MLAVATASMSPTQAATSAYRALREADEPPQLDDWDVIGVREVRRRPSDSDYTDEYDGYDL